MKKEYKAPTLTIHGTIEEVTKAFGVNTASDTIFYNNRAFPGDGGSVDGVVVPLNP